MTEFRKPKILYDVRPFGEYTGWACSEPDPYDSTTPTVLWVRIDGGTVTADVVTDSAWDYEVDTGIVMTADEIMEALV